MKYAISPTENCIITRESTVLHYCSKNRKGCHDDIPMIHLKNA